MSDAVRSLIEQWRRSMVTNSDYFADQLEDALAAMPPIELDNHHNALACPYCNPKGLTLAVLAAVPPQLDESEVQLLAWAVTNCHMLARRALARSTSAFDREKWEHVLRITEKAGARSQGVLRAALPTEMTEGAALAAVETPQAPSQEMAECVIGDVGGAMCVTHDNPLDWVECTGWRCDVSGKIVTKQETPEAEAARKITDGLVSAPSPSVARSTPPAQEREP